MKEASGLPHLIRYAWKHSITVSKSQNCYPMKFAIALLFRRDKISRSINASNGKTMNAILCKSNSKQTDDVISVSFVICLKYVFSSSELLFLCVCLIGWLVGIVRYIRYNTQPHIRLSAKKVIIIQHALCVLHTNRVAWISMKRKRNHRKTEMSSHFSNNITTQTKFLCKSFGCVPHFMEINNSFVESVSDLDVSALSSDK